MRYLGALWRLALLILRPGPGLAGFPVLLQPLAALLALLGLGILAPRGPMIVAGAVVVLIGIAAFKLQLAEDERGRRKALIGGGTHSDRNARRLVVINPNDFPAVNAFVSLHEARVVEAKLEEGQGPPGLGFRFAWGSWQVQPSGLLATIPAHGQLFVDIVGLPEGANAGDVFFHHHVSGDPMYPIRQVFPCPRGIYEYDLALGAEDLPVGKVTVAIDFREGIPLLLTQNQLPWG